jgi:hypothetical protein
MSSLGKELPVFEEDNEEEEDDSGDTDSSGDEEEAPKPMNAPVRFW